MKKTFNAFFKLATYLIKGYTLKNEDGARFANSNEENHIFNARNKGLLIDGNNKRLSEKDSFEHLAIIAKPGVGKTTSYIIPNILDKARQKCSLVVTDPSGEIFSQTSAFMKSRGFNILTLNPDNLELSSKFNPFDGLGVNDIIEIEKICSSIILSKYGSDKDPIWNEGAISILEIFAKCLAFSSPSHLNLPNINYLINLFGEDGKSLDDWVAENSINPEEFEDKSIINAWVGLTKNNKNMLTSYATIAKTALKQLNNSGIQKLLASNDLNFRDFRKQKTILYLIVPAHQQDYYQFIIDLLYTRFFSQMMDSLPKRGDLNIYCMLDEFGSSYIHGFASLINNIRKYRVSLSIVFQSLSQLEDKYGKSSEAIKGGIGHYLVFSGADYSTAKEMSDIMGKRLLIERNNFTDLEQRYQELTLLSPDKIRTLQDNQCVFLSKNRHPLIIETTPFYKHFKFNSATKKGACELPKMETQDRVEFVKV
ncbi:MAG: type IV secretory system conjugative DNA transfer family protein [Cellulophaga sp.]